MLAFPALRSFRVSNWVAAHAALADAPGLFFEQAWLPPARQIFRKGIVRLGWCGASIILGARLEGDCIFTRATADGQRLWELGDVFEIFLRDVEHEDYLELHVAPGGKSSQFRFPSCRTILDLRSGVGRLEDFTVREPLFEVGTRIAAGRWEIIAQIPAASLGLKVATMKGRVVLASFSRCDYANEGGPAVLSSTSPHAKPDFHRQQEWRKLIFC
jgi:hypothetical protein